MPEPTDEELGTLLRETFADREALIGRVLPDDRYVPTATKRRRVTPALLAAAMVLVVLAGVLYGVQRVRPADTAEPAATPTASPADYTTRDAEVWGLAIGLTLRRIRTLGKSTGVSPFTQAVVVDGPTTAAGPRRPGPRFSSAQRVILLSKTLRIMPVKFFDQPQPAGANCKSYPKTAIIRVGDVLDKGDHLEVGVAVSTPTGCRGATISDRYRVEPRGAHWVITQTLGPWTR